MRLLTKTVAAVALSLALGGCSLGGLLGGGGKPPATLSTLTPEAAEPGAIARTVGAGQAVTIAHAVVAEELRTVRVPVAAHARPTSNMSPTCSWVDTPASCSQPCRGNRAAHHQSRRARSRPDRRSTRA